MTVDLAGVRTGRLTTLAAMSGPSLCVSGGLITSSQLVIWPLLDESRITTLMSPAYVVAMPADLVGLWFLVIGLFAVHSRQAQRAGTFGLVAACAAALGTVNMAGNVWFDTFVAPWLARQAPVALGVVRDGTLVVGALSSYLLMALGWMLFGVACLRARVLPRPLAALLIPAGILAYTPMPPSSILFGLIVLTLGVWLVRHHD